LLVKDARSPPTLLQQENIMKKTVKSSVSCLALAAVLASGFAGFNAASAKGKSGTIKQDPPSVEKGKSGTIEQDPPSVERGKSGTIKQDPPSVENKTGWMIATDNALPVDNKSGTIEQDPPSVERGKSGTIKTDPSARAVPKKKSNWIFPTVGALAVSVAVLAATSDGKPASP
jgi:hypothetical protein